jgi:hypothetical protein
MALGLAPQLILSYTETMLGLTSGELTLVALLVFAVVSARFWPAAGASLAVRLLGSGRGSPAVPDRAHANLPKSERTSDADST